MRRGASEVRKYFPTAIDRPDRFRRPPLLCGRDRGDVSRRLGVSRPRGVLETLGACPARLSGDPLCSALTLVGSGRESVPADEAVRVSQASSAATPARHHRAGLRSAGAGGPSDAAIDRRPDGRRARPLRRVYPPTAGERPRAMRRMPVRGQETRAGSAPRPRFAGKTTARGRPPASGSSWDVRESTRKGPRSAPAPR